MVLDEFNELARVPGSVQFRTGGDPTHVRRVRRAGSVRDPMATSHRLMWC